MRHLLCAILIGASAFSIPGFAQSVGTCEFYGTVSDTSGALIPDAELKLVSSDRGLANTLKTNAEGYFSFANLLPGPYRLEAGKPGFETYHQSGLTAIAGRRIAVNIVLNTGSVQQSVVVTADAPLLETGNNEIGQTVDNRKVKSLPLLNRDYTSLLVLSGNARAFAPGNSGGPYVSSGRSGVGTVLGGTRFNAMSVSIDGVDDNTIFFNRDNVRLSIEGVEEVRVITSSPSAEYGRNLGAVITVISKSGSNDFHGSLFEFHRDNNMSARNAFATVASPFYLNNHFGGSLGGPILKNRLFFFGDYEGGYVRSAASSTISVPPIGYRNGDFTGAQPIFDPGTTTQVNGQYTRTAFPNNTIPVSRMDAVGRTIATQAWPVPNSGSTVYATQVPSGNNLNQYNARSDYRLNDRSQIALRYSYTPTYTYSNNVVPDQYGGSAPMSTWGTNAMIQHVYNFTPTLFNEFRFGFNRAQTQQTPLNFGTDPAGKIGLTGTSSSAAFSSFPSILTSGYYTIGSGSNFLLSAENIYHITDNVTWVHERHTFKGGLEFRHLQSSAFGSFVPFGQLTFGSVFSSNPAQPTGSGNVMADLLLGYPQTIQLDTQFSPLYPRQNLYGAFFQDEFRVTRSLTLNLGLRYELFEPVTDKYDRISNPNIANPNGQFFVAAPNGSIPSYVQQEIDQFPVSKEQAASMFVPVKSNSLANTPHLDFSPRFGFSWQPGNDTVVRGGFGVYRGLTGGGTFVLLGFNAPNFIETFLKVPDAVTPVAKLETGIPNFSQGQIQVGGLSPRYLLPDDRTQTSLQWNLTFQRKLLPNVTVEAGYIGQHSRNLTIFLLNNQIQNPANYGKGQNYTPVPFFGNIWGWGSGGVANYHAGMLQLTKRYSAGLTGTVSYTLSRSLDNAPGDFANGYLGNSTAPIDSYNLSREYGPSAFDTQHRIASNLVYALPFGRDRRFPFSSRALNAIAGGWNVSFILAWQTGLPVDMRTNTNLVFSFNNQNRPNCVASPDLPNPSAAQWFNPAAFANPAQYQLGNCGRNTERAPGIFSLDTSLAKDFQFGERVKLEVRGEAYNTPNHVNLGAPNNFLGNPNFARILSADTARQLQVGARLTF